MNKVRKQHSHLKGERKPRELKPLDLKVDPDGGLVVSIKSVFTEPTAQDHVKSRPHRLLDHLIPHYFTH